MTRRLLLIAFALSLVATLAQAVPQIMAKPKEGKWVGKKIELTLVKVVAEMPEYDFTGKIKIKDKSYDIKLKCDQAKGNWGVYTVDGEEKTFQLVADNNNNTGTIKIQDPYEEFEVKWEKDDKKK